MHWANTINAKYWIRIRASDASLIRAWNRWPIHLKEREGGLLTATNWTGSRRRGARTRWWLPRDLSREILLSEVSTVERRSSGGRSVGRGMKEGASSAEKLLGRGARGETEEEGK